MKCSNCGNEFDVGIFCPKCGFKNEQQEVNDNGNQENTETVFQSNTNKELYITNNVTSTENTNNSNAGKGLAIVSLIMGILSILTIGAFIIPEILGIVFAFVSKKGGEMRGIAKAGLICSIVSIVLLVLVVIFL